MPTIKTIAASVAVQSDQKRVFEAVTNWDLQRKWIFATKVSGVDADSHKLGSKLEAFTGYGKFGFMDTMTITKWDPPNVCEVTHTGKIVKGSGKFEVITRNGATYFVWTEYPEIPFGIIGNAAWPIVAPFARIALKISLVRFRKMFENTERKIGR